MPRRPTLPVLVFSAVLVYSGAASATVWHDGDLVTYTQADWGDPANAGGILLYDDYDAVYASTPGVLEVGVPGAGGFSTIFTGAPEIQTYLPAVGPIGPLTLDLLNPTSTASGAFGGEVLGLKLNVDFSDAALVVGASGLRFGDLILSNLLRGRSPLNGLTVRQFLAVANTALGGGSTSSSIADLDSIAVELNGCFYEGTASSFAQDHLEAPALPVPVFPYSDSLPRGYEEQAPVVAR